MPTTFPWNNLVKKALKCAETPFYLFSSGPVLKAKEQLRNLTLRIKHEQWLSFKTLPIRPLINIWKGQGLGIEVVSEFEFLAALKEGFRPNKIIINGPAKHTWLYNHNYEGIWVNFDSLTEVQNLAKLAARLKWNIGIRCKLNVERDPDEKSFGTQFGMVTLEILEAAKILKKHGVPIVLFHFHLGTNIRNVALYKRAIKEILKICEETNIWPRILDLGGGLACLEETGEANNREIREILKDYAKVINYVPHAIPSCREVWLENGRFITSLSTALVVKVLDIKERKDSRYLICNGGRTNHALVSDWEHRPLQIIPRRKGKSVLTTVCGNTCMAYDRLGRFLLPGNVKINDVLVWLNAGAYHLPWETQFSHGYASVLWEADKGKILIAREAENFEKWWGRWARIPGIAER